MAIQQSSHRSSTGRSSSRCCNRFRWFVSAAIVSQLLVFRYLARQWPVLDHPYEPPTSNLLGSSEAQKRDDSRIPDGSFNGIPIYYNSESKIRATSVQCLGENFESNAWIFRSCKFQNLCFDTNQKDFVYIQSTSESDLKDTLEKANNSNEFITISPLVTERTKLSLGPIRPSMSRQDEEKLQWFPRVVKEEELSSSTGFYEFPPNRVLVPFQATSSDNDAQLVWDDFFPIYTLLSMFQLTPDDGLRPFLVSSEKLPDNANLWYDHLLQLVTGKPDERLSSIKDFRLEVSKQRQQTPRSNLICSSTAVAGLGMVADRGFNLPERWKTNNPAAPPAALHAVSVNLFAHNVAQGIVLKNFRDWMLKNLKITPQPPAKPQVAFYWNNQANDDEKAIMTGVLATNADVTFSSLKPLEPSSMVDMAKAASESSVLVVECCSADAALVASFLPLGSSLLVVGGPLDRAERAFSTWELLYNAGYIRTHWFSKGSGEESVIAPLVEAMQKELLIQKSS